MRWTGRVYRCVVWGAAYVLSGHLLVVSLRDAPATYSFILLFFLIGVGIAAWLKSGIALYGFVIAVPFLAGLHAVGATQGIHLISMAFAVIYLVWLPKRLLVARKGIGAGSAVGKLVDVLSGIVLLSLFAQFWGYPADFLVYRVWKAPFLGQDESFHAIRAAYIILQGLFLFRLIRIETHGIRRAGRLQRVFYAHAVIILLFSTFQLASGIPKPRLGQWLGIYSPFIEIHAYGAYIALLSLTLLGLAHAKGEVSTLPRWASGTVIGLLFLFVILSGSRVTWVVTAVGVCAFVLIKCSRRTVTVLGGLAVLCAVILVFVVRVFPSAFEGPKDVLMGRLLYGIEEGGRLLKRDRQLLWRRTLRMMRDYPCTGSGVGTFYRLSPIYDDPIDMKRLNRLDGRENAHNYFLQFGAELGVPALLVFLATIGVAFRTGVRLRRESGSHAHAVRALLFGLGVYLAASLTQHPLLLSSQQFLIWFALAAVTMPGRLSVHEKSDHGVTWLPNALLGVLAVLLLAGYAHTIRRFGNFQEPYESGYYPYEMWGDQKKRWTMQEACIRTVASSNLIGFGVSAAAYNSGGPEGLECKLFLNDELLDNIHFFRGGDRPAYHYVPSIVGERVEIGIEVSRTFKPSDVSESPDDRVLGVATSPLTFLQIMPPDGIGFYLPEPFEGTVSEGSNEDETLQFRWTGMRASMPLQQHREQGITLLLFVTHPDVERKPVWLEILGDDQRLMDRLFYDHDPHQIELGPDQLRDVEILTFHVDRTWNPRLSGVSDDPRDLGIGVVVSTPQLKN